MQRFEAAETAVNARLNWVVFSRTSLDSEGIRLVEAIKSLSDPLKDYDLALLLLILSLSCRLALESGNGWFFVDDTLHQFIE